MSKAQRKKIEEALGVAEQGLAEMVELLDDLVRDLQEKFDNKSEKWQESEKGEAAQERINEVESLRDEAQGALDTVQSFAVDTAFPEAA